MIEAQAIVIVSLILFVATIFILGWETAMTFKGTPEGKGDSNEKA